MCGRFSFVYDDWSEVIQYFHLSKDVDPLTVRYNTAPGQMIPSIISDGSKRRIGELRWGLIPHFATDEKAGYKMINARSETLAEKPAFRHLLSRKRCIIPLSSFYEWKQEVTLKQPMCIFLKNRKLFSLAGLYDTWTSETGKRVSSCTIITTKANHFMNQIHNRMPIILSQADESVWLDRSETDVRKLMNILKPYPDEDMDAYKVSTLVNKVQNDTPECLIPLDSESAGGFL